MGEIPKYCKLGSGCALAKGSSALEMERGRGSGGLHLAGDEITSLQR